MSHPIDYRLEFERLRKRVDEFKAMMHYDDLCYGNMRFLWKFDEEQKDGTKRTRYAVTKDRNFDTLIQMVGDLSGEATFLGELANRCDLRGEPMRRIHGSPDWREL